MREERLERIVLKRCKRKKVAREGEKREEMNERTKGIKDVDVVIVAEKRVGTENRREEKEGRGRKGERLVLRRCMMKNKAGRGKKNGKGGWMKVIRGTRSAE